MSKTKSKKEKKTAKEIEMSKTKLFDENTQSIVYGYQVPAIQRMLDFDFVCGREKPSIAAIVNPSSDGFHQAFCGAKEILIPIYKTLKEAVGKHKGADVVINFASFRSTYEVSKEALGYDSIKTLVIIAEGLPERRTRELIAIANEKDKVIIGPATVGGITAGKFKIGNTGGTIESIIESKLYKPGCVGFVSKSGGMSNEMYNVISRNSNGLYEGIAIGGDKFPGSTLLDHINRFEKNSEVKMIVALGEVGGEDEYLLVNELKKGKIKKPVVVWVTGTCAKAFPSGVQFGHAGAKADSKRETADFKNEELRKAGAIVPKSFDDLGEKIKQVYDKLVKERKVKEVSEKKLPELPLDFNKALAEGKIRKPASFVCTISDDRKDELLYAGIPISKIIEEEYSLGDVISLLWFRKRLPSFAAKFLEMVLMIVADHGPAVSGAHNAIVTARAGKDLVSSLASGLLTVGPRFGGAIDGAAKYFKIGKDKGMSAKEFVEYMKKEGILIPGIGHRVKSLKNPDRRVELLKSYAKENFKKTDYLNYALEVEKITTEKKANLILNVDGTIGVLFLDLMKSCNEFKDEDIDEVIETGYLNGLFVLGRSIGIMGHVFDQKRLKAGLYRHPWEDINYLEP